MFRACAAAAASTSFYPTCTSTTMKSGRWLGEGLVGDRGHGVWGGGLGAWGLGGVELVERGELGRAGGAGGGAPCARVM